MLRIKALEEEGFTFSSLTWWTASPQTPGRGIRASAGSASRNTQLDFTNEAKTMSGEYLQSSSWSAKQ